MERNYEIIAVSLEVQQRNLAFCVLVHALLIAITLF